MQGCPFCFPSDEGLVVRWDHWTVIYNHRPVVDGHCLLVPNSHISTPEQLSDDDRATFFIALHRLTIALLPAFNASGYDLALQIGTSAGQSVEHLHFHCLPRREADLPPGTSWTDIMGIGGDPDGTTRRTLSSREQTEAAHLVRSRLV